MRPPPPTCQVANRHNALFYHLNALNYARSIDRLQPADIERLSEARG